jgi:hypothetical protein
MLGCEYAEKKTKPPNSLEESLCAGEKLELTLIPQINTQDPLKTTKRKRPRKTQKEITMSPEKLYQ